MSQRTQQGGDARSHLRSTAKGRVKAPPTTVTVFTHLPPYALHTAEGGGGGLPVLGFSYFLQGKACFSAGRGPRQSLIATEGATGAGGGARGKSWFPVNMQRKQSKHIQVKRKAVRRAKAGPAGSQAEPERGDPTPHTRGPVPRRAVSRAGCHGRAAVSRDPLALVGGGG